MKNILLLIVILAIGLAAYVYYKKKTSNGVPVSPNPIRNEGGAQIDSVMTFNSTLRPSPTV